MLLYIHWAEGQIFFAYVVKKQRVRAFDFMV